MTALSARGGHASRPAAAEAGHGERTCGGSHHGPRRDRRLARPGGAHLRSVGFGTGFAVGGARASQVTNEARELRRCCGLTRHSRDHWRALLPVPSPQAPDRERHHRSRRFCQQHWRCCFRRHAEDRAQRFPEPVAVLECALRKQSRGDIEADDPPARHEAHTRRGSRALPAAGSKAYIAGSIASLGSQYVVGLKAVNCQSGDTWRRSRQRPRPKRKCWTRWARQHQSCAANWANPGLGAEVRCSAGTGHNIFARSFKSLQPRQKSLSGEGAAAALPYDQRAIELDPNFAVGYRAVGDDYYSSGRGGASERISTPRHSSCEIMPVSGKSLTIAAPYYQM